jgi:RNA polymerase sigma-70 factor (ECF subfamily)
MQPVHAYGAGAERYREQPMEDIQIVALYFERNEAAIAESDRKYGRLLRSLSLSYVTSREDAEECVNDTYLDAWNAIPPQRPSYLGAFLSKITRRISIDRFRHDHRSKRGGTQNLTEELTECIPDGSCSLLEDLENQRLGRAMNAFLATLSKEKRVIFVQRYFYGAEISQIAEAAGKTQSNVKVTLHRTREALREFLRKEDLL